MADIVLFNYEVLKLPAVKFPKLHAWHERVKARKATQACRFFKVLKEVWTKEGVDILKNIQ